MTKHLYDQLCRFESHNWNTTPARKLEATLHQLEVLKTHFLHEQDQDKLDRIKMLESRLAYYLPLEEYRNSNELEDSLPFKLSRQIIEQYLRGDYVVSR